MEHCGKKDKKGSQQDVCYQKDVKNTLMPR